MFGFHLIILNEYSSLHNLPLEDFAQPCYGKKMRSNYTFHIYHLEYS